MLVQLKKILPLAVSKLGLGSIFEFNQLFLNWDKILSELFGEDYKNKARPISLKNKILTVDCLNSVWASELQLRQEKIIIQINQIFNKNIVREIKFIS